MTSNHNIYGFVGPSGSGKSTIILKLIEKFPHLQIVKSTSTRPKRDDQDDYFYNLVSNEEFQHLISTDKLLNFHKYADFWYGTNLESVQNLLQNHCGIYAVVEYSVEAIRKRSVPLKLIKIDVENSDQLVRQEIRGEADQERMKIPLRYDFIVTNSFAPGGLEQCVNELSAYFESEFAREKQSVQH